MTRFSCILCNGGIMSKVWVFIGGVAVGIAGLITAALVCDKLENGSESTTEKIKKQEQLALPEVRTVGAKNRAQHPGQS